MMSDDRSPAMDHEDGVAGDASESQDVEASDVLPIVHDRPPITGNDGVDAAVRRLAELDGLPTVEHAGVFDDVQGRLQHALSDLDGR